MKQLKKPLACTLAALLLALPVAAGCSEKDGAPDLADSPSADLSQDQTGDDNDITEDIVEDVTEETEDAEETEDTEAAVPEPPPSTETPPGNEEQIEERAQYILVKTNGLNVRTGAGTSYTSLGQAEQGTLLKYSGKTGNWYETYYRNRVAYVSAKAEYTTLYTMEKGSDTTEAVIEEGLKLLGTPYVYGAVRLHDGKGNLLKQFTLSKFDCSSLMQYIFHRGAGILLNTTTRTQSVQGTAVSKANLRRGDLIFFTNSSRYDNTGVERIGHVALYLGENYILHTASDFAKIEQISATRWSYYITSRRMV